MSNASEYKYWNAFKLFSGFNLNFLKRVLNYFPSLETAFKADSLEFKKAGLDEKTIGDFLIRRKEINPDQEWEKLEKEKIKIITIKDKNYPPLLSEIYDPPLVIYYKGNFGHEKLFDKNEVSLAVVGTRKCSPYGLQVAEEITKNLAENGLNIISGLALGVDTIAHKSALEKGAYTVAVLGSGIDEKTIYPPTNLNLAREIIEKNGAIISEHPYATPPLRHHFPLRNRIISGLSIGTLVIEAPYESGALITARSALDQNREVFAVPGNITSRNAEGPNNLIKLGAHLVTSGKDILEILNLKQINIEPKSKKIIAKSPEEEIILKFLSKEPIHIDKLSELSKLETAKLNSTLTLMEMENKVKNLGSMNYILN